jgi:hypothetical protein
LHLINSKETMEPSTTPQPLRAATPRAITPEMIITIQQIPFTAQWVVQVDGEAVQIAGEWNFASEALAQEAARTLLPTA